MSTTILPLGELCELDRKGIRSDDPDASRLPFVGVEHVVPGSGVIDFQNGSRIGTQKSTAFRFDKRHVLYGKLRPYLNKVATPEFAGRCSTELVPLLPRPGIDRSFLAHLLRRQATVDFVMATVTGSRMPRTDMKALLTMRVRLPPPDEQRRIVGILNRAAKIERLRAKAQERLREFVPALFVKMFGDASKIAIRFPCRPLKSTAEIASGATKGRKIDTAEAIEVPYLRVANVQDGYLNLGEIKTITIRKNEKEKYALAPGDLIMTEGGDPDKLGRAAVWKRELSYCAHQNHVFRVRPHLEVVLTEYLQGVSCSVYGKAYFQSVAKQTTGIASINKTQLGNFPVPVPPIELQARYAQVVGKANLLATTAVTCEVRMSELGASLMSRMLKESR